jgi:hypothetical protein
LATVPGRPIRRDFSRDSAIRGPVFGAREIRQTAYLFCAKSQTEQLRYMPPEIPMERFFIRLTMRVGFPHVGHGGVSAATTFFARSAVFAFSAIGDYSFLFSLPPGRRTASPRAGKRAKPSATKLPCWDCLLRTRRWNNSSFAGGDSYFTRKTSFFCAGIRAAQT